MNPSISSNNLALVYFLSAALLLLIMNGSFCLAAETGTPGMVLVEKIYDAKEIKENQVIEHTFKVRNNGDGPLEITKIKPG